MLSTGFYNDHFTLQLRVGISIKWSARAHPFAPSLGVIWIYKHPPPIHPHSGGSAGLRLYVTFPPTLFAQRGFYTTLKPPLHTIHTPDTRLSILLFERLTEHFFLSWNRTSKIFKKIHCILLSVAEAFSSDSAAICEQFTQLIKNLCF